MILHQLKEVGIKISIDNFGTGYSSLHVLNRLPMDFVKIDRSSINEVNSDSNIAALVKTIIISSYSFCIRTFDFIPPLRIKNVLQFYLEQYIAFFFIENIPLTSSTFQHQFG